MSDFDLFMEALARFIEMLVDQMWHVVAAVFDLGRNVGPLGSGLIVVGACMLAVGVAHLMQRRLTKKLARSPKESVSIFRQEVAFSLPAIALFIVALPAIIMSWVVSKSLSFVTSLFSSNDEDEAGEAGQAGEGDKEEDASVVVASIGPSFMWAGLLVAGFYALGRIAEPLLRYQLDLADGYPAWQYLIFGNRPELEWYLPIERFPYLGALLAVALWMTLWWWTGRAVRVALGSELGSNLAERIEDLQVLKSWRTYFGARKLFSTDASYRSWSIWLPFAASPFLLWSWGTVSAEPYRMGSSMFAVSLVLWLSWVIHLTLEGHWHIAEEEPDEEPEAEAAPGRDWSDVLEDLRVRLQVEEPHTFEPPRKVDALAPAKQAPKHGLISPLLGELLPADAGFTHMQQAVLETLSHQAYVHVDPPSVAGELALGRTSGLAMDDASGLRHRNQVVLAPDAHGKTTLAMLAACNHALVHTRATLVVTRSEQSAERFCELMNSTLEPSTLRWTVRARQAGTTLVNDLSQGIIPDVVVTSLHQLVVGILDNPKTYAPFLKNLGLVVVDDVESFCGPVEIHMQLAFRRLTLRVRELLGTRQLGEESAPVTLILGADSMHDTPTWAKTLCGVDAVTRVFGYGETPVPDHPGLGNTGLAALTDADPGRYHLFYQLSDFASESGESVSVHDIIAACERLEIPWHYRTCGDMHRHEGRRHLKLDQEPQFDVEDPLDACVVFLDGHISNARRESAHLCRAGARFHPSDEPLSDEEHELQEPVPIAFIGVVDPDERMALTELNPNSSLSEVIRTLPRPVVRAPFGRAVEAHLSADLVDTWMEVADILDVFGNTTVGSLERLADAGFLVFETRTDLDAEESSYEDNLYVRVPSKAVASSERGGRGDKSSQDALLAAKVTQVERPPGETVAIRDRTNLTLIARTDRVSARHVYYPGRIFESAKGRFVVVGAADEVGERNDEKQERGRAKQPGKLGAVSDNDILVEPFLNDDVSSPRRRAHFRTLEAYETLPGERTGEQGHERLDAEPVFMGDYPVSVSLGPVECHSRHLATFRLDPHSFDVRQRILFAPPSKRRRTVPGTIPSRSEGRHGGVRTVALAIMPNPALEVVAGEDCPRLELRDARLIAAAMRAVLPSMYRGSDIDIEVALHIDEEHPAPDYVLGPNDGFYLYDPHLGGNGAAQAVHRDGVELLLRLCRVYLERVLYHDRLRARYDLWADEDELFGRRGPRDKNDKKGDKEGDEEGELSARERDQQARKRALTFLDSRLRPESSVSGAKSRKTFGVGSEEGEGDVFDIGRCWYSEDGTVTDLIWTKHRWMLDDGGQAMCDIGVGRKTAAKARTYTADTPQIRDALAWVTKQLDNPAFELDDQTIWGRPNTVWALDAGESIAAGSDANLLKEDRVLAHQKLALAVACDSFEALAPLAELLAERSGAAFNDGAPQTSEDRLRVARFFADFVQGIPFDSRTEPNGFDGPVHALLYRLGNQQSQTLLLALLLKHAGVDAGLFYHPKTGGVMCAAGLPQSSGAQTGDAQIAEQMAAWRERHARSDRRIIWGELPPQPGSTSKRLQVFVPIATDKHAPIAAPAVDKPEQWVFLPLSAAWLRLGVEDVDIPGVQ